MSKLRAKYNAPKMRVVLGSGVTGPSAERVESTRIRRAVKADPGLDAISLALFPREWRRPLY